MSKGSGRRPRRVSREEFERRWAETFGLREVRSRRIRPGDRVFMDPARIPDGYAQAQPDGDPGDDYATERAGA